METRESKPPSTYQMLSESFPGAAPAEAQIEAWKEQVPNGNLALWTPPDGKRFFILRGITGIEMRELGERMPANASDADYEYKLQLCCAAVVWTNTTPTNKLRPEELRASTAGLVQSLSSLIETLSDFFPPAQLIQSASFF